MPEGARREIPAAAVLRIPRVHRPALSTPRAGGGCRPLPRKIPYRLGRDARGALEELERVAHRRHLACGHRARPRAAPREPGGAQATRPERAESPAGVEGTNNGTAGLPSV